MDYTSNSLADNLKKPAGLPRCTGYERPERKGKIKGIAPDVVHCTHRNTDGFELKLRQMLDAQLQPPPHSRIGVSFETFPEGVVCRVDVPAHPGITYFDNTEVYVRDGNRSSQLTGRNLVEWSTARNTG